MEEHLQVFGQMYEELAEVEVQNAAKTGPYSAELTLHSKKTGSRFQVRIELTSEAPHLIASLGIESQ